MVRTGACYEAALDLIYLGEGGASGERTKGAKIVLRLSLETVDWEK